MVTELAGAALLIKQLRALGALEDGKAMRAAARAGIKPAAALAKATIPVGSVVHKTYKGRLVGPGFSKRSLRAIVKSSKDKQGVAAVLGVAKEAFYAVQFVELGKSKTHNQAAQPWLVPTLERTLGPMLQNVVTSLRASLKKATRAP